jgi:hypothetical protein
VDAVRQNAQALVEDFVLFDDDKAGLHAMRLRAC